MKISHSGDRQPLGGVEQHVDQPVVELHEVVRLPVVPRARREQRDRTRSASRRTAAGPITSAIGLPSARSGAIACSPSLAVARRSTAANTRTSLPWNSAGRNGSGGALRITTQHGQLVGRRRRRTRGSPASTSPPARTGARSGRPAPRARPGGAGTRTRSRRRSCRRRRGPPRTGRRSRASLARTSSRRRAVTTSAESRLSTVSPCLRLSQPKPPPSVSPAMPVVELMPSGVARPNACASRSNSPSVAPGSTRAVRAAASTRTDFISDRSSIRPPSHTALPAMLCPPPRTATSRSRAAAKRTAAATSAAGRTDDRGGPAVDHRVPDRARGIIAGGVGCQDRCP